jgi:hypothetical protein
VIFFLASKFICFEEYPKESYSQYLDRISFIIFVMVNGLVHVFPTGVSLAKLWPLVYELPRFPAALSAELQNAKSVLSLNATAYHAVIRILYEDTVQCTL